MHPRERILAVLNREPVDRLPVDLWHTPEIVDQLCRHLQVDNEFEMWQALELDKIVWNFMDYLSPEGESAGAQVGAQSVGSRTMWGVPVKDVQAGAAVYQEFTEPPLRGYEVTDLDNYPYWPDPDHFDYDGADALARRMAPHYAVIGPWVSFFEIYCQLRGIEQGLMDLALNPDLVHATLDRIEAIQTEMLHRFYQRSADVTDLGFISDDIGGQKGLLMSPRMWRRHLQPRLKRWCDVLHSYGIQVFYHTDGGVGPLIPELLDCGLDVLNPIQHACPGMDTANLKRLYGNRVIFHGGIDNQHVLPFGTVDEVRTEVQYCMDTLGAGGEGYIVCSCHNVQPGTPVQNILAMVEKVKEPE
ncbi:MAG: uroporphyrinogen decarboxylase family protein [Anaerolineae bacterium]|nr:uroporphyrinogen decarboxylase family protein [Anaerolineae bacterium]